MGSFFYLWHLFGVQSTLVRLPAWVSSLVVLHTPISKALSNALSVVACSCGPLLAVCCNRAIAAGVLPQDSSLKSSFVPIP